MEDLNFQERPMALVPEASGRKMPPEEARRRLREFQGGNTVPVLIAQSTKEKTQKSNAAPPSPSDLFGL